MCLITFDKFLTNVKLFHVYIKILKFYENWNFWNFEKFEILKFFENFEIWFFFLLILEFWNFMKILKEFPFWGTQWVVYRETIGLLPGKQLVVSRLG
jgi:hypothetical protein